LAIISEKNREIANLKLENMELQDKLRISQMHMMRMQTLDGGAQSSNGGNSLPQSSRESKRFKPMYRSQEFISNNIRVSSGRGSIMKLNEHAQSVEQTSQKNPITETKRHGDARSSK
jgi:hypothetical protein